MKPQPESASPTRKNGRAADDRRADRDAGRKRTFQMRAGSGKTMFLSYLLSEKEQLSSDLAAVRAAHADIQDALEAPAADPQPWTFLCGSFRSSLVVKSLYEVDSIHLFDPDDLDITNLSRFFIGPIGEDENDASLTPRQRAMRRMLRCRLALAAFLERLVKNRLKTLRRGISLILRERAHEQRHCMFAREIPWFLQHGCHPPAETALRFDGLFSAGMALIF